MEATAYLRAIQGLPCGSIPPFPASNQILMYWPLERFRLLQNLAIALILNP